MTADWAWEKALTWADVPAGERRLALSAPPEARAAIADTLDLEGLACLEAAIVVSPWLDGIEARIEMSADVTRLCGVSLEPFDVRVEDVLRLRVVPEGSPNAAVAADSEVVIDLEADDPPDTATDGQIDLAGYVVEVLALALDPFPRKPGAVFMAPEPTAPLSPFAVLASLPKRTPSKS